MILTNCDHFDLDQSEKTVGYKALPIFKNWFCCDVTRIQPCSGSDIMNVTCFQVVELQNKLSEESKKADKMEFEYKRVKEKVDSLQKDKDVRDLHDVFSHSLHTMGSSLFRRFCPLPPVCVCVCVEDENRERFSEGDD